MAVTEAPAAPSALKVTDVAKDLQIGRSTVYELMDAGELESFRIGGSRRIPADALEDYKRRQIEAERARNAPPAA